MATKVIMSEIIVDFFMVNLLTFYFVLPVSGRLTYVLSLYH